MTLDFFLRDVPSNYARPLFDEGRYEQTLSDHLAYEVSFSIGEGSLYTTPPKPIATRGSFDTGSGIQYFVSVLRFTRIVFGLRSIYLEMSNPYPVGIQFAVLSPLEQISEAEFNLDYDQYVFPATITNSI